MNNQAKTSSGKHYLMSAIVALVVIILAGGAYAIYLRRSAPPGERPLIDGEQINSLTIEQILNANYKVEGNTMRFENGRANLPVAVPGENQADYFVSIDKNTVVFGDLNNDGAIDAAVIMNRRLGGSGTFVSLAAVLNQNGSPRHIVMAELGDRVIVPFIRVRSNQVELELTENLLGNGAPRPVTKRYSLIANELIESSSRKMVLLEALSRMDYVAIATLMPTGLDFSLEGSECCGKISRESAVARVRRMMEMISFDFYSSNDRVENIRNYFRSAVLSACANGLIGLSTGDRAAITFCVTGDRIQSIRVTESYDVYGAR